MYEKKISKQIKTTGEKKEERKGLTRNWDPHILFGETCPYHYTTEDKYISQKKGIWFTAFYMELLPDQQMVFEPY